MGGNGSQLTLEELMHLMKLKNYRKALSNRPNQEERLSLLRLLEDEEARYPPISTTPRE